jgi:hypothetical protein
MREVVNDECEWKKRKKSNRKKEKKISQPV